MKIKKVFLKQIKSGELKPDKKHVCKECGKIAYVQVCCDARVCINSDCRRCGKDLLNWQEDFPEMAQVA